VIETGGRFLRVQIKSTISRGSEGGYICGVRPNTTGRPYDRGEFDFLAAYIISEDVWYIIPARLIIRRTTTAIRLYPSRPNSKYAPYKEAWHLLCEAAKR
jgi:hypothetical protein